MGAIFSVDDMELSVRAGDILMFGEDAAATVFIIVWSCKVSLGVWFELFIEESVVADKLDIASKGF